MEKLKLTFSPLQKVGDFIKPEYGTGLGIYIWGFKSPGFPFIPYYVGQTEYFRNRFLGEFIQEIPLSYDWSKNKMKYTLHKKKYMENPENEVVFKRVAKPGPALEQKDFEKLVYFNDSTFMLHKYGEALDEISKSSMPEASWLTNWEEEYCKKNTGCSRLFWTLYSRLNYYKNPAPELKSVKYKVIDDFMDVYRTYIIDPGKEELSDRLMATIAVIDYKNSDSLRLFETILKFSLIKNVGSESMSPPTNKSKKEEMEGMISFDGPDEIGELFHQDYQQDHDRLFTWRR